MSLTRTDADVIRVIAKMIDLDGYKDSARSLYDIADRVTTCPHCGGEGANEIHRPQHDDPGFCEVVKCDECNGSGYVPLSSDDEQTK